MSNKKNPPPSTAPPTPSVPSVTQAPFPRMEPPHMYTTCPCPYHPVPFPPVPHVGYPASSQPSIPPFQIPHPPPYYGMMPMSQGTAGVRQPHSQPPVMQPSAGPSDDRGNTTSNEAPPKDRLVELHEPISLSSTLRGSREFRNYPVEVATDNFCKFLEHGCIIAEQIAINNSHRSCFRKIASLCDRTRGDIIKPINIAANIHSQGLPLAAKDFIYTYVRLINSWHMVKNYIDSDLGSLRCVKDVLTPEFRNTFKCWERDTKLLASHLIHIFTALNENIVKASTSLNPPVICVKKNEPSDIPSTSSVPNIDQPSTSNTDDNAIKENSNIPPKEIVASTSKTGTIKKQLKQTTEQKPISQGSSSSSEEFWPDNQLHGIQSTLPYIMTTFSQSDTSDENDPNGVESLFPWNMYWPGPSGHASILKPSIYGGLKFVRHVDEPTTTMTLGNKTNAPAEILWEYEMGGLTPNAIVILQTIVDVMNKESFTKWLVCSKNVDVVGSPTQLDGIRQKVTTGGYRYINQFVFDMKSIISNAMRECESNKDGMDQLEFYDVYFHNMMNREFLDFDFSHVGDEGVNLGPLVRKN